MANIDPKERCRAFYVELAKESYGLQGKDVMAYVEEQVKAFHEARIQQMAQQREERAEAREVGERAGARRWKRRLVSKLRRRKSGRKPGRLRSMNMHVPTSLRWQGCRSGEVRGRKLFDPHQVKDLTFVGQCK